MESAGYAFNRGIVLIPSSSGQGLNDMLGVTVADLFPS